MDHERAARLLYELQGHAGRVSLSELGQALPDVDVPAALAELRLLRGVMLLESPSPGASLSRELRRQLSLSPRRADTPAMPAEPESTAVPPHGRQPVKPPAFRCGECRRKFRLRNLHGGARFDCPLCGAAYRTWADASGQVQVEPCGPEPHADLPPVTVRPLGSHAVLGVPTDASPEEIKQAYRRLMKEHHPDRAAGLNQTCQALAEERSKEINHAYAQLLGKA